MRHVASIHEEKRPFKCEICDYSCTEKRDISRHVGSVHAVPARGQAGAQPAAVRPKPAPVARPEIDLGASEHEWKFFVAEFERYKRTTGISGTTVLDELWHCQAKSLRSLMQAEASITSLDTEILTQNALRI